MRLALIPPYALANVVRRTDYQLLLPQCVAQSPEYVAAYKRARAAGSFLILDNGVAEGENYTAAQLHVVAQQMMVNEIVVHDVMQDAAATWNKVKDFKPSRSQDFNYMGVIQGTNWEELKWITERYASENWINSVGIPRHLITTMSKPGIRVDVAAYLNTAFPNRFNVHLLGTNPEYIKEVWDYRYQFESAKVRGVDTSAPFNYAYALKSLARGEVVNRPAGYFSLDAAQFDEAFLDLNLRAIGRWNRTND